MRTTVDLPEPLLQRAKRLASDRGTTLSAIVAEALGLYLVRKPTLGDPPFDLIVRGRDGARMPAQSEIDSILEAEDAAALRIPARAERSAKPRGSRRAAS